MKYWTYITIKRTSKQVLKLAFMFSFFELVIASLCFVYLEQFLRIDIATINAYIGPFLVMALYGLLIEGAVALVLYPVIQSIAKGIWGCIRWCAVTLWEWSKDNSYS